MGTRRKRFGKQRRILAIILFDYKCRDKQLSLDCWNPTNENVFGLLDSVLEEAGMSHCTVVSFGAGRKYAFTLSEGAVAALSEEAARAWLIAAFDELGCVPSNPMGKVLVVDMILGVAKKAGEARFRERNEWAERYAEAVARLRKSAMTEVDVEGFVVR